MRVIIVPIRTARGGNNREHWRARHLRVKAEREAVAWLLPRERPALPVTVTLHRIAPSNGLDSDNLAGALKAIRDQVAAWLEIDDRDPRVMWRYEQRRGPWGVGIQWVECEAG